MAYNDGSYWPAIQRIWNSPALKPVKDYFSGTMPAGSNSLSPRQNYPTPFNQMYHHMNNPENLGHVPKPLNPLDDLKKVQHKEKINKAATVMSDEETLKKIEAFISGPVSARPKMPNVPTAWEKPDDGRGDVQDPKHDKRLKQNKRKSDHEEMVEQAEKETEHAGEDENKESQHQAEEEKVHTPYERERVDHRAAQNPLNNRIQAPNIADIPKVNPKAIPTPVDAAGPMTTQFQKNYVTPKAPPPPKPQAPPTNTMDPEEHALRNHPKYGPMVRQWLGPKPKPSELPAVHQKIKNLESLAEDKNEFQEFVCKFANYMFKQMTK